MGAVVEMDGMVEWVEWLMEWMELRNIEYLGSSLPIFQHCQKLG